MSTSSRLIHVLPSQVAQIGELVRRRRGELGLTQAQLAKRYNKQLSGEASERRITRFRIAKIEGAAQPLVPIGSARALHPAEVKALAGALELPVELFAGADSELGAIWDPLSDSKRSSHVLSLLNEYDRRSKRFVTWARYLPCSMETLDFMRAHNAAVFRDIPDQQYRQKLVDLFNHVGTERRQQLLADRSSRAVLYHLIFLSDLERIALGRHEYRAFSASLRANCLRNLIDLISDPAMRVHLIVAEEGDLAGLDGFFGGLDCLLVFDAGLAKWRDLRGYLYWSTGRKVFEMHSKLLAAFREAATYRDLASVVNLLETLLRRTENIGRSRR